MILLLYIFFVLLGKINFGVLEQLVKDFNADDPMANDQQKLERWNQVSQEYSKQTSQTKSRTTLMKKWSNLNKSKEKQKVVGKVRAKKFQQVSTVP